MVLVTVGVSGPEFRRLFDEVERLIAAGLLEDVVVQVGSDRPVPAGSRRQGLVSRARFLELLAASEFVISHAGCGTLDDCLGLGKKVIAVPREARFGEAPDDHQLEIVRLLAGLDAVLPVFAIDELERRVAEVSTWQPRPAAGPGSNRIPAILDDFVERLEPTPRP